MTKDGILRTYNFTIIDTPYNHVKYLREFGIKKLDNKTLALVEASEKGEILKKRGVPLNFKQAMYH